MNHESDSELVAHGPCDSCGSSDACAHYTDDHRFCFSCGTYYPGADSPSEARPPKQRSGLAHGEYEALVKRGISKATCEKFGYKVGQHHGRRVQIAPYTDAAGRVVAQKLRFADKEMTILGDLKDGLPLFGQHLWRDGGKMIVVTEGEIDALSVAQAQGLKWPAVSIPNGAQGAAKAIAKALPWLETYERVILMFDMDEPGRAAADECAQLLTPGKAYIAKLPLKDANEMVQAGRSKEIVDAAWDAQVYRPDILNAVDADMVEEAVADSTWGLPWPWATMTRRTYGIRRSALYTWGAGTGSGKTTLVKQLALTAMRPDLGEKHDFISMPEPRPVAAILYEEPVMHTVKTLGGMVLGKRVHVPGVEYDKDELRAAINSFLPLFKSVSLRGARNWETVKSTIRWLHAGEGVRDFIIDPMTALTAGDANERSSLDGIMSELAELAEALNITVHLVFHLATPDGKSHEDGGRVQERHFRGSRAVAFWSHYLMGLERDKQDPDCPTVIRGLKDRLTGDAVGPFIALAYNRTTGLMEETEMPEDAGGVFANEEETNADF